jgi:hypothetical protein
VKTQPDPASNGCCRKFVGSDGQKTNGRRGTIR